MHAGATPILWTVFAAAGLLRRRLEYHFVLGMGCAGQFQGFPERLLEEVVANLVVDRFFQWKYLSSVLVLIVAKEKETAALDDFCSMILLLKETRLSNSKL